MADQASIFGEAAPASGSEVQPSSTPAQPQDQGLLNVLVGEGQKYKDIAALVKGHLNADDHIARLEAENRKLREQAASAATMDDVLKRLQTQGQPAQTTPAQEPQQVDPAAIAELVKQTVTGMETARTRAVNLQTAEAGLREVFGDKAKEVMVQRAGGDSQKLAALKQLAEVAPQEFLALFKPAQTSGTQSLHSTVNAGAPVSAQRHLDPATNEYWTEMRRKDPAKYYSKDMQLAKQKAALANPKHYFGS